MVADRAILQGLNEAIAHHNGGRFDRADALYAQLARSGRDVRIFHLWGQLAEQQGRLADATARYGQALAIDPSAVATAIRLACTLVAAGRAPDAEAALKRVLQRVPRSCEAWNMLGFVTKIRGRLMEAVACQQKAVEINPRYADGWCQLGLTLGTGGKNYQALQCFEHALKLDSKCHTARYGRAQSLQKVYRIDEAVADYDEFLEAQPANFEARSFRLFALQNLDVSRERLFAEHQAYGRALTAAQPDFAGHDFDPERRLRIAVLSPDLRTHSCAYFLEPLLRHLDPAAFEIVLYHDHFVEDAVTARLRRLASVWRNFVGQTVDQVERVIRADRPDVLIDLNGHVANTIRLPLFAKRLAPVQINYLGYPDTTGVPNMDFRFTDDVADPAAEGGRFATETLVRFASTAWAYQPDPDAPPVSPPALRAEGEVTFGCFNSPMKLAPSLLRIWAKLLAEMPRARLLLKGRDFEEPVVRDVILQRMRTAGIPLERVELLPRTRTTVEHLNQYSRVDIALDTSPYNGTTTTCEAMWMGRPVVSLRGDRHASRVGASLLTAVGRTEWIAEGADEYVAIAKSLAADPKTLGAIAAGLRDELQRSSLLDHRGQSRRFARALRACWRQRCLDGKSPEASLDVSHATTG